MKNFGEGWTFLPLEMSVHVPDRTCLSTFNLVFVLCYDALSDRVKGAAGTTVCERGSNRLMEWAVDLPSVSNAYKDCAQRVAVKTKLTDPEPPERGTAHGDVATFKAHTYQTCQRHWREELALRLNAENALRVFGDSFLTFCCVYLWWHTHRWELWCSNTLKGGVLPPWNRNTTYSWVRLSTPSRTWLVSCLLFDFTETTDISV